MDPVCKCLLINSRERERKLDRLEGLLCLLLSTHLVEVCLAHSLDAQFNLVSAEYLEARRWSHMVPMDKKGANGRGFPPCLSTGLCELSPVLK